MKNILIIFFCFIAALVFAVFAVEISYYKAAEIISYVMSAMCMLGGFVWGVKCFFKALAK